MKKSKSVPTVEIADGILPFLGAVAANGDREGLWNIAAILLPQIGIEIETNPSAPGTIVSGPVFECLKNTQSDFNSRMDETREGYRIRNARRKPKQESIRQPETTQAETLPGLSLSETATPPKPSAVGKKDRQPGPLFSAFWEAYPKKVGKRDAIKAFEKLEGQGVLSAETLPAVLAALDRQRRSQDWMKDDGQYIPHPATWLNGRRWEDAEATDSAPAPSPKPKPYMFD